MWVNDIIQHVNPIDLKKKNQSTIVEIKLIRDEEENVLIS